MRANLPGLMTCDCSHYSCRPSSPPSLPLTAELNNTSYRDECRSQSRVVIGKRATVNVNEPARLVVCDAKIEIAEIRASEDSQRLIWRVRVAFSIATQKQFGYSGHDSSFLGRKGDSSS